MCTGVNVNARTNLFPPQNTINDRRMDAVCNKDTILRHPSSQDFCGPHISGATSGHTPFTICCATQQTLLCLNIDSFRRPHQRQKTHHPNSSTPPSWYKKPPYLSCPFRRCFKGSFDVFWRYVSHIKRNSSGCDQQHYVAEDSLFSPPPHQKTKKHMR